MMIKHERNGNQAVVVAIILIAILIGVSVYWIIYGAAYSSKEVVEGRFEVGTTLRVYGEITNNVLAGKEGRLQLDDVLTLNYQEARFFNLKIGDQTRLEIIQVLDGNWYIKEVI